MAGMRLTNLGRRAVQCGGIKTGVDDAVSHVTSGTYTPVLTLVTNLDASSNVLICLWRYTRIGDIVTCSGRVNLRSVLTMTRTVARLSLPVPSAFTQFADANGAAAMVDDGVSIGANPILVDADPSGTLSLQFMSIDSGVLREVSVIAQYLVL